MLVIVNAAAGGGRALAQWRTIAPRLRALLPSCIAVETREPLHAQVLIAEHLARGETHFVAAGGDGTVNLVATTLVETAPPDLLARLRLGAIGLGSSNDFHKPRTPYGQLNGVPYRLDFGHTVQHDVGVLTYDDEAGNWQRRFWLLNASLGITAEANRAFNRPNGVLRWLKRSVPPAGMTGAALRGILCHRSIPMTLTRDDAPPYRANVHNLAILKNPNVSGILRYDSPYQPNGGRFYVHLLEETSLAGLGVVLYGLARGRFAGRPGTHSWRARRLAVEAGCSFTVEADGETVTARRARFSVLPAALQVCT